MDQSQNKSDIGNPPQTQTDLPPSPVTRQNEVAPAWANEILSRMTGIKQSLGQIKKALDDNKQSTALLEQKNVAQQMVIENM